MVTNPTAEGTMDEYSLEYDLGTTQSISFASFGESLFFDAVWNENICAFCNAKLSDKIRRLRHEWYCHIKELFPTD